MTSEDKRLEDSFPQLQRKLYLFEAKDVTKPSRILVQFLRRFVECLEPGEGVTSKNR